ncbi:hypothetical protein MED121_01085 [Marinomonas sp. MED121]|nr:hypothetical protein MED121_01085 [Marinomonas sp. MED121]
MTQLKRIKVPSLFIAAENGHMLNKQENSFAAHNILKQRGILTVYHVIPEIDHYRIYFGDYEKSSKLTLNCLVNHLK